MAKAIPGAPASLPGRLFVGLLGLAVFSFARADVAGLLYDPQPPADSAYVRVINAAPEKPIDVAVDGRARIRALAAGEASDYLVLPAGKRTLRASGPGGEASAALDVVAGRAITVAFPAGWVLEDRANTNKLKAVIAAYHLAKDAPAINVQTAEGTKVFANLRAGTSASLVVNPVNVELVAVAAEGGRELARAKLAMQPGGTYSFVLQANARGELAARAFVNKVERYTRP